MEEFYLCPLASWRLCVNSFNHDFITSPKRLIFSMLKVPSPGEDHGDVVFVAGFDDLFVVA